jgi:hypothetical protein
VVRRSLDDALTPEEQSFLEQGKPAKAKSPAKKAKAKTKPTKRKEETPMARPALKEEFTPPAQPAMVPNSPPAAFAMSGVVSLNVRIEPEISTALLTASMQRKIQRQNPHTQRDIVSEALADWLRKHGHLK